MKDIPYSKLKQNERAYDIMLLRDQYDNTFTDIAKEYEISAARVSVLYRQLKMKQAFLYINHIAVVLKQINPSKIRKLCMDVYECYREWRYVSAYLEKKYKDILIAYRAGEPGMPVQFVKRMPPFKRRLSKQTASRVIEMREDEKASFVAIAKELRMTQAKAKRTYEMFYHKQVLELVEGLQEKAESSEEKIAIWDKWFGERKSYKELYDLLTKK